MRFLGTTEGQFRKEELAEGVSQLSTQVPGRYSWRPRHEQPQLGRAGLWERRGVGGRWGRALGTCSQAPSATEWALAGCLNTQHICVRMHENVHRCSSIHGIIRCLAQHPVCSKCSINVRAASGTFTGSLTAKGRRGTGAGVQHQGVCSGEGA